MSYSQYSSADITDSSGDVWSYGGIISDAARYDRGGGALIAFETHTNAPGAIYIWRDDGGGYPSSFSHSASGPWTTSVADAQTIYMSDGSTVRSFTSPHYQYYSTGGSGAGTNTTNTNMEISNVVFTKTSDITLKLEFDYANLTTNEEIRIRKVSPTIAPAWFDVAIGGSGSLDSTDPAFAALQAFLNVPCENGTKIYFMSKYEVISAPGSLAGSILPYSSVPNYLAYNPINPFYHHLFIDWSTDYVNGVKTVFAKFYGVDTGLQYDGRLEAYGPSINEYGDYWNHDGTLQTVSHEYKSGRNKYKIMKFLGNGFQEDYGNSYTSSGGKVSSNFW